MKRSILVTLAACTLIGLTTAPPALASSTDHAQPQTGSPLRFTLIQYDPPGDDLPATPAKLNAEYVTIYNPTAIARTMTGFRVHDLGPDHTYKFATFQLGPHKSVRLHTGPGRNTATNRYWNLDNYVWNNTGDTAFLVSNIGTAVDSCHWGDGSGSIHC